MKKNLKPRYLKILDYNKQEQENKMDRELDIRFVNFLGKKCYIAWKEDNGSSGELDITILRMDLEEEHLVGRDSNGEDWGVDFKEIMYINDINEGKGVALSETEYAEEAHKILNNAHDMLKYNNHKNTLDKKINILEEKVNDIAQRADGMLKGLNNRLIKVEDFLLDTFHSFDFADDKDGE